ncbi:MAG: hypothetical protein ACRELF_08405 [Gemmataceae bacterium]
MGAAGPAIIFVMLLAASTIVGICVLAYAARCVLVVVQETGLGQDEIIWPSEPMQDWLGHAVQFVELVGIWLAPSALAARLLRDVWLPHDGALRVLMLAGPGLWLFFPIGLLSSLSAQSRWVPFRWTIFTRFLRVAPSAVIFYFLTALLLGVAVAPWYYALFGGKGFLLPAAAAVSAVVLFIYARLLGRLAWIIQRLPSTERTPAQAKTEKRPPTVKPRAKKKRKPKPDVHDPWGVPKEEAAHKQAKRPPSAEKAKPGYHVPSAEEIEGYGFAAEKPAEPETPPEKPPRSPLAMSPEEYEPIDLQDTSEAETPTPRESQSELFAEQVRQRIAERTRVKPVLPAHPFLSGVYTFPLYSACLPNGLALFLAFLVIGGLVHQLIEIGGQLFGW